MNEVAEQPRASDWILAHLKTSAVSLPLLPPLPLAALKRKKLKVRAKTLSITTLGLNICGLSRNLVWLMPESKLYEVR